MRLKDHLNKLEYFSIIVESGSVLKASHRAHVSQPQLSKVIRQLEELLDKKLLVRSSSGVVPTQSGIKLYNLCKKMISATNETELLIKSDNEKLKGTVRLGTYDSISRYFFPDFLKFLKSSMPDLVVLLETGRSNAILKKLRKGDLDITVAVSKESLSRAVVSKKIYSDAFGLYKSPKISIEFEKHLILFPESLKMKDLNTVIGICPHQITCSNLETVKALTEEGLGVGLIPNKVAREGVLASRLVAVENKKITKKFSEHDIVLSYSKDIFKGSKHIIIKELERFLEIWSVN